MDLTMAMVNAVVQLINLFALNGPIRLRATKSEKL
jgi:hypothetical protein